MKSKVIHVVNSFNNKTMYWSISELSFAFLNLHFQRKTSPLYSWNSKNTHTQLSGTQNIDVILQSEVSWLTMGANRNQALVSQRGGFASCLGYRMLRCDVGPILRKLPGLQNCLIVVRMWCPHDIRITQAGM